MRKGVVIGLVVSLILNVVLVASVFTVGGKVDAAKAEQQRLQDEVDDLTEQSSDAEQARDTAQKELEQVKAQAGQGAAAAEQVKTLQSQLTDAQNRAQSLQTEVDQLKAQLNAAQAAPATSAPATPQP